MKMEFCFLLDLDVVNIIDLSEKQFNLVCIDAGCFSMEVLDFFVYLLCSWPGRALLLTF